MNIDLSYLGTIPQAHPTASAIRWGCSFDGRQLALVGYLLEPNGDYVPVKKGSMGLKPAMDAVVFFATLIRVAPSLGP